MQRRSIWSFTGQKNPLSIVTEFSRVLFTNPLSIVLSFSSLPLPLYSDSNGITGDRELGQQTSDGVPRLNYIYSELGMPPGDVIAAG